MVQAKHAQHGNDEGGEDWPAPGRMFDDEQGATKKGMMILSAPWGGEVIKQAGLCSSQPQRPTISLLAHLVPKCKSLLYTRLLNYHQR